MPRLGQKYEIEVEVLSKPIAEYNTDDYFELELPVAPAIMVEDEILVEGSTSLKKSWRTPSVPNWGWSLE